MTFLEKIVQDLQQEFGDDISSLCLVVPTRRAVLFLKEALAAAYQKSIWAPEMMSIQDFVRAEAGGSYPDSLPLVFDLYQVYGKRMRAAEADWDEAFEQFYAWGEMLLKDFDEVDKYCADAKSLFTNVKDLKEIEAFFTLEGENLQALQRFWETIRGEHEDRQAVQSLFLKFWEVMYDVYTEFKAVLAEKNEAYDGMAYEKLVAEVEAGSWLPAAKKVVFIGFNALSEAERRIMEALLVERKAIVYWDADRAYFTPKADRRRKMKHLAGEEPGKFVRQYHDRWEDKNLDSRLIIEDMQAMPKQIYHTGVPLMVGQAQYVGNLLREAKLPEESWRKTAVVLADENLLFPVLYALPKEIEQLNITMGFGLRQTNIFDLLTAVMGLIRNLKFDPEHGILFSYKDVRKVLNNPYIKAREQKLNQVVLNAINQQNLTFVPQKMLLSAQPDPFLSHVFQPPVLQHQSIGDMRPLLAYCQQIFLRLLENAQERNARLEAEYIFQFFTQFNQLSDILLQYQPDLSVRGFTNLFREVIQKVRIPFEGEPLVGMQVMGFLETRVLDFERIYILSANEGNLPDTSTGNSFIPFNLRKAFGLPTFEEKDAIYAYHFYRLLQRVKEVHLIYNTVVNDVGGAKEISRFIRQLRHFFPQDHPTIQLTERTVSTPAPYQEIPAIEIESEAEILAKLKRRYVDEGGKSYLSATAMTTYLACPLRFYYRYVAGIREEEEVEESMEANTFGSVLHLTMENLYKPLVGQTVNAQTIQLLLDKVDDELKKALAEHEIKGRYALQGQNHLYTTAIQKLCRRMLRHDAEMTPFEIESLESETDFATVFALEDFAVRLNGMFDRVDVDPAGPHTRILDYKTGKVKIKSGDLDKCFEPGNDFKEVFQGYLYAWLYRRRFPMKRITVGYYPARQLGSGIHFLDQGNVIANETLDHFGEKLAELINQIFTAPFTQTEDETKCRYCPYRDICQRG